MPSRSRGSFPAGRAIAIAMLAAALALSLSSCVSTAASGGAKLVYFIFNGYTPPYFAPMANGIRDAAKHYGDLDIKILSANGSASTEINELNQAKAAGAKGIILNPVDESVTATAKRVSGQVPLITIDRDVTDPSARIAFIGDNDQRLGTQIASTCLSGLRQLRLPRPWHIVDLQGTQGASTAVDRETGIQSVLKPLEVSGQVKVVLNQSANFATDTAQTLMSEYLAKTTDIQAIISGNDAMALGAINALHGQHVTVGKQTLVCGADAQPESLSAIRAGTQYSTVTHAPYVEAFWAVEAMNGYLTNKVRPSASLAPNGDVLVPQTVVTATNVASVGGWGTPTSVPPLPYSTAKSGS